MVVVVPHQGVHITLETTQLVVDILTGISELILHLSLESLKLASKLRYGRGRTRRCSIIPNIYRRCRVVRLLIISILPYVLLTSMIVFESNPREREERSSTSEPRSPISRPVSFSDIVKSSEETR